MLFSLFFFNLLFAQSNNGTNITGDDAGWGDRYDLIYKVDGVLYKTITLEEGAIITPESSPTKEGYTFSGWSEIPSTMPAKDVVVTGSFSINSYKLTYVVDGAEYKTYTIEYGSAITAESIPSKEGYTFSGWSETPSTMPANDVRVTGTFSINSYKLTYVVDGVEYKTYTIEYGSAITAESIPSKEGYTFSGWSEIPSTMPAKDVVVTGTFSINSYKLTYVLDGEVYKTLSVKYATEITPEADPTKEGYSFSGWVGVPQTMPAKDVEVSGSFTVNKYLLTIIVDGIVYFSDSIAYGTKLVDYIDLIAQQGIDITSWEYYEMIESISMPAHDVVINGLLDAVMPLYTDERNELIYDLRGKKLNVKDISTLQPGIYIRNGHKYIVR